MALSNRVSAWGIKEQSGGLLKDARPSKYSTKYATGWWGVNLRKKWFPKSKAKEKKALACNKMWNNDDLISNIWFY